MWCKCEDRGREQRSQPKLTRIDQKITPELASCAQEEAALPQVSVNAVAELMGRAASMRPVLGLNMPIQGPSLDGSWPSGGQLDKQSGPG